MSIRSHVDPCTFIAFIHINEDRLTREQLAELLSFRPQANDFVDPVLSQLDFRSRQIMFHETYHVWQGLRLPFLHRYAFLEFRVVAHAFTKLSQHSASHREWDCYLPEMHRLDLDCLIGHDSKGHIFWTPGDSIPDDATHSLKVTPLDLLECAATIAEYQVTTGASHLSPSTLRRWAKRNPAYLVPYEFAAEFLDDEHLALRVILPLINASCFTTDPTRAFVELLARLWGFVRSQGAGAFLAQSEPCRWPEVFQSMLDQLEFDGAPDSNAKTLDSGYIRLTLDKWVFGALEFGGEKTMHPFIGPLARRWSKDLPSNPEAQLLLDFPSHVGTDCFYKWLRDFGPPITVLCLHQSNGENRTFMWGRRDLESFTTLMDADYRKFIGFAADFLTMYGAVRRASGAHFDQDLRTCHHQNCPEWLRNACNIYPIVPDHYRSCGFVQRLEGLVEIHRGYRADSTA